MKKSRRSFIFKSIAAGVGALAATKFSISKSDNTEKKVKLLSQDGKLVEVDQSNINSTENSNIPAKGKDARKGIPGRKFVMVIDLSKCGNARKCIEACQKGHNLLPDQEYIKVHLMQDNQNGDPYWFPKPCNHCGNPPCVKVCPVGATFKRTDNVVLVDIDRCIGCKFCIVACPYSARIFNWKDTEKYKKSPEYSPETSVPGQLGTAGKCDFCPDLSRKGKLPYCVSSCPNGALYFGDANEDVVTNGDESLRFRKVLQEKAGYRYLEHLGTEPNVYYLPPVDRMFPYKRGLKNLDEKSKMKYNNILSKTEDDE